MLYFYVAAIRKNIELEAGGDRETAPSLPQRADGRSQRGHGDLPITVTGAADRMIKTLPPEGPREIGYTLESLS